MDEEFCITEERQKEFLLPIFIRLALIIAALLLVLWSEILTSGAIYMYLVFAYWLVFMLGLPLATYFSYLIVNENTRYSFNSLTRNLHIEKDGHVQTVRFADIIEVNVYAGSRKTYNRDTWEGWSEDYYYRIKIKDGDDIMITSLTGIPHNLMGFPVEIQRHYRLLRIVI